MLQASKTDSHLCVRAKTILKFKSVKVAHTSCVQCAIDST